VDWVHRFDAVMLSLGSLFRVQEAGGVLLLGDIGALMPLRGAFSVSGLS